MSVAGFAVAERVVRANFLRGAGAAEVAEGRLLRSGDGGLLQLGLDTVRLVVLGGELAVNEAVIEELEDLRAKVNNHPIEQTGTQLRDLMSWVDRPITETA